MTILQGKDLFKNAFKGGLEEKNRARSILSSTIKNEVKGRTYETIWSRWEKKIKVYVNTT